MRRFHFNRTEDASGVSGTGRVAEGVLFDNGLIALSWMSIHKCVNVYASVAEMQAVHGHEGKTELIWVDPDPNLAEAAIKDDPPPKKTKPKTPKK